MNFLFEALKKQALDYQGQEIEEYLVKGPITTEEQKEINYDQSAHKFLSSLDLAKQCYDKQRQNGGDHHISWKVCNCDELPIETRLQLESLINNNDSKEDILIDEQNKIINEKQKELESFGFNKNLILKVISNNKNYKSRRICITGLPSNKRLELCKKMSDFYQVPYVSVEDMIQNFIHNIDLDCQKETSEIIELAYNDFINNHEGFILEGYPISLKQSKNLGNIDLVTFVDMDVIPYAKYNCLKRWCPVCMYIYHLSDKPPIKNIKKCDRCGTVLTIRPEDQIKTIKKRYYNWRESFNKIIEFLKNQKKLVKLSPDKEIDDIAAEIEKFFE